MPATFQAAARDQVDVARDELCQELGEQTLLHRHSGARENPSKNILRALQISPSAIEETRSANPTRIEIPAKQWWTISQSPNVETQSRCPAQRRISGPFGVVSIDPSAHVVATTHEDVRRRGLRVAGNTEVIAAKRHTKRYERSYPSE